MPSVPAGTYHLYADVVHAMGFPETIVGTVTLPAIAGRPLAGDDAEGNAAAVGSGVEAAAQSTKRNPGENTPEQRFRLSDGYTMVWRQPPALIPKAPVDFRFSLLDPQGKPAGDIALYMGMLGHAAFVKTDARFSRIFIPPARYPWPLS